MRLVGLDPGVKTGYAESREQIGSRTLVLCDVRSVMIHEAMARIICAPLPALVIFEDARLRKKFNDTNAAKYGPGVREGVGSVKRDCKIWEDFLTAQGIPFISTYPCNTKRSAADFTRLTGWPGATNEHGRDAGMLIFGMSQSQVAQLVLTRGARAFLARKRRA